MYLHYVSMRTYYFQSAKLELMFQIMKKCENYFCAHIHVCAKKCLMKDAMLQIGR